MVSKALRRSSAARFCFHPAWKSSPRWVRFWAISFPVWLKFKGGKGVATFLGVSIALYWPVGFLVAATWLGAALIWRISSLSALIAIALSPAYFLLLGHEAYAAVALLLSALITYMHRDNIRRLLRGEEPRIGAKT